MPISSAGFQPSAAAGGLSQGDFFALMAQSSPDWESWLAPDGRLLWVSDSVRQVAGFEPAACEQMTHYPDGLIYPADRPRYQRFRDSLDPATGAGGQMQVRIQRRDGAIVWVSMLWQSLLTVDGRSQGWRISIRDVSLSAPNDYLLSLRKAASRVMQAAMAAAPDLPHLCRQVTEGAANALRVARASVWLFDETGRSLDGIDLYVLDPGAHECPGSLAVVDYPRYMQAIGSDQLVVAHDALTDPMTCELAEGYLRPLGITSMLDAPIVQDGKTVGVLCCEHSGGVRHWGAGELAFVETLSDFIALALETSKRQRLQEQTLRLASIIEAMPDLVTTVAMDGRPNYINQAGRRLLGLAPRGVQPVLEARHFYTERGWDLRQNVAVPTAISRGHWAGETELVSLNGEHVPVWQTVVAHRNARGEVEYLSSVIHDLREQKCAELALRQREQQLRRLNDELEQRVAERTRQIQEVNRNLETFAFSVSHDLKAPLRGIDGYGRLLLEDYGQHLPPEAQDFIANIRTATSRMHELIDDLLAYSRVSRRELAATRFSVRQAIRRVLNERRHDVESHHVQIIDRLDDVQVHADLECFVQIVRNLIDNAVKFTRDAAEPKVELNACIEGGRVLISVKDNGCGFDMKYHDRIFSIFQRLHRVEDYPGTGVGLAIVSKAAERLGGRVWAVSQVGQGAEFFLELPHEP